MTSRSDSERRVRFAEDLDLPVNVATQGVAFLARRGAGKTYAASVLAEGLLDAGVQTVVLDPIGVWWGLRLDADGKSPGFSIPVIGGYHGDLPLEEDQGERLARMAVELGTSAVLDVSKLRKRARNRFVARFAEELFELKKQSPSPLHLIIEEAQKFAPQQSSGSEEVLGAIEDLCRLGRNLGVGFTLVSQRPQSVNKEVLSQVEMLVVMQTTAPHERKAIAQWVAEHGDAGRELVGQVPELPVGEAIVWSPQWLREMRRVKILTRSTFDASATPEVGRTVNPGASLGRVDVGELAAFLAREADQGETPPARAGKRRGATGKTGLAVTPATPEELAAVEEMARKAIAGVGSLRADVEVLADVLDGLAQTFAAAAERTRTRIATIGRPAVEPAPSGKRSGPATVFRRVGDSGQGTSDTGSGVRTGTRRALASIAPPKTGGTDPGPDLRAGARRMLAAIAMFPVEGLPPASVAAIAGLSVTGGTFATYVSNLKTAGLARATPNGRLFITGDGLAALTEDVSVPKTSRDLLAIWSGVLRSGAARMLEILFERGDYLARRELADAAGLEESGGTFSTYLSNLRTNELIVEDDQRRVRIAPIFAALDEANRTTEGRE